MQQKINTTTPQIGMTKIWKNYNDSMVFLLPLFSPVLKNICTKSLPKIEFPFVQVCLDHGLINTYLIRSKNENLDTNRNFSTLFFLFDTSLVNSNLSGTTYSSTSLHKALLKSDYFEDLTLLGFNKKTNQFKYSLYGMKIPQEFSFDLQIILKSRYSAVSDFYRNTVELTVKTVPVDSHPLGVYLTTNNMPYSIAAKKIFMKTEIEETIDHNLSESSEYYTNFRLEKEVFNQEEFNT